jgi:hypothetical protein
MKKYEQKLKETLSDVICDVCGRSCVPKDRYEGADASFAEFATLKARWGYFSGKDEESLDMEFCEGCFEKILVFVKSISEN